jgi:hypothetical protein
VVVTLIRILDRVPLIGRYLVLGFQRHLDQEAAVKLVVHELDFNAEVVSHDRPPQSFGNELQFSAWDTHRQQVIVAARRRPDIRDAVISTYDELRLFVTRGALPPSFETLRGAADLLRELTS